MAPNTLTEVKELRPGDIFCRPGHCMKFKKITAPPVRVRKKLYQVSAVVIGNGQPILFRGKETVIFLHRSFEQ